MFYIICKEIYHTWSVRASSFICLHINFEGRLKLRIFFLIISYLCIVFEAVYFHYKKYLIYIDFENWYSSVNKLIVYVYFILATRFSKINIFLMYYVLRFLMLFRK